MITCDVLVAGGGSAGFAAAVASARAGADTILIERSTQLGGMASNALVHTICGLFLIQDNPKPSWANNGFARYFSDRLLASGGARTPVRMGRLDVLPHEPTAFAALASYISTETPLLRVFLDSEISAVCDDFQRVQFVHNHRLETIHTKSCIDTTGDAALVALGGAAFEQVASADLQRPAYISRIAGLPSHFFQEEHRLSLAHAVASAVQKNHLPQEALGSGWRPSGNPSEGFLTIDLAGTSTTETEWNPCSPQSVTQAANIGKSTARALTDFVKKNINGCTSCSIIQWPEQLGIRESRRARGVYELTAEDILNGTAFDDAIAFSSWPIELRHRPTGPRWKYPRQGTVAQIPLRSLRHHDVSNLWFAGRCISSTHEAQGSLRVIGTCLATGEAAGLAAAASLDNLTDWNSLAAHVRNNKQPHHTAR